MQLVNNMSRNWNMWNEHIETCQRFWNIKNLAKDLGHLNWIEGVLPGDVDFLASYA